MNPYPLQQILKNDSEETLDVTRYMFYRSSRLACPSPDGSIMLVDGENYDFSTYFNAFSLKKWQKYTFVTSLYLVIDIQGDFIIDLQGLYKSGTTYQRKIYSRRRYSFEEKTQLILKYPTNIDGSIVGFEVLSNHNTRIYEAYYGTDPSRIRVYEPYIALITTTFKKEAYVYKNIDLLTDKIFKDETYGKFFCWNIIDNGRTLEQPKDLHSNIKIYSNQNIGGAGGFARGMIEAIHQNKKPTHVLLMDDDVVIHPESFKRLYTFLSLLKEEYKDYFISGAMLKMDQPNIQHEDIGVLKQEGYHEAAKRSLDVNVWEQIVENELFEPNENEHYYAAWWFCCIPAQFVRTDNLPIPVFVRGDDVEYSLRNHAKFITLNGICIWHEGFEGKFSAAMEFYQVCRNELIISAILPECANVDVFGHVKQLFWEEIYKFNYKGAALLLEAVEDFLKGPEFIKELDGESVMKKKKASDNQLTPITTEIRQQINLEELYSHKPFHSSVEKFIYDYTFNGQARIPDFLTKKRRGVIPYGWGYFPEKLQGCNEVIAVDLNREHYVIYKKSRHKFKELRLRYRNIIQKYETQKDELYARYQAAFCEMVSESYWKQRFNENTGI